MSSQEIQDQPKKGKTGKQNNNDLKNYARYSGMAVQMVVIIAVMTYAGVWLDERREAETPVFTLILSLLGVFAALYSVLKDFIGKK